MLPRLSLFAPVPPIELWHRAGERPAIWPLVAESDKVGT